MASNAMQFNSYLEAFALGLTKAYRDTLQQFERSYDAFLREETAERWFDTDWSVSGLGAMPSKAIGAAITTDSIIKSATKQYALTPYALGCVVEYEAMKWDIYGVFQGLPEELAKSAMDRYNIVGHSPLNNGFVAPTTDYNLYNGDTIFSATHTRLDGGTWSNRSSTDVGLSYLGLQQANIDLGKLVNERGRFVQVQGRLLITSVDLAWWAQTLVRSEYRPDNANQALNTVKGKYSTYDSPYLSSSLPWYIVGNKTDVRIKMRLGEKPRLEKDNDVRNKNLIMTSYCSFGLGVFDSRGWWGSLGNG